LNKTVSLSDPAKADLIWWVSHLKKCNGGKPFSGLMTTRILLLFLNLPFTVGMQFESDGFRSREPWTAAETHRHLNELEHLAAYFSLQAFSNSSDSNYINLFIDKSTAVAYINKCGGTYS
jgi:hypothetical protein